jgi:non-canonical (house-cleaning) NTP pyrophosphatase
MRVAVGSTRQPEVEAVKEAWRVFSRLILQDPEEPVTFLSYHVPKNAPELPLSIADLMEGARSRVENLMLQLKRERQEADFYVGLESGLNLSGPQGPRRLAFLESWAYVSDGHLGYFGHGGGICVPPCIADPAIDRDIELGIVLDRLAATRKVASEEGVWGVLTHDLLSRKHSFVTALLCAFAPFYQPSVYR